MDDKNALKEIKNMGETDLLNLYYGYYGLDEANTHLAQENARLLAAHEAAADELARVVQELREAREAFAWVEQHVTDVHVGFTNDNPVRVNWIDDNGNDREGKCKSKFD